LLASSWRCSPTTSTSPASQVFSYRYWRYSCGPSYSAQPSAASWAFTSRASISPDPTPEGLNRLRGLSLSISGSAAGTRADLRRRVPPRPLPSAPVKRNCSSTAPAKRGASRSLRGSTVTGSVQMRCGKPRCPSTNQTPALNRLPDRSAPLTRPRKRGLRQHLRGPRSIALSQTPV